MSKSAKATLDRRYRRVQEAAEYLGLSKSTLDKLRVTGNGPAYAKLGAAVIYDVADLDAWVAARRAQSTSGVR